MTTYNYADWVACTLTRRSVTSYCVIFRDFLISWKSKKQTIVSTSSMETEYRALSTTVRELQLISYLLVDMKISSSTPYHLWCDKEAALHIVVNHVFHERTKQLEIDCHLVRKKFKEGFIMLSRVSSQLHLAYTFTKSLFGSRL